MLLVAVGSSYPAGPVEAFALIWMLYRIPTIWFSLYLFREWQRWRKTFRNGGAPLDSVVVEGTVAADSAPEVVMLSLTEERARGGPSWHEVERKLDVVPFYLVVDQGDRVLIDPDQNTVIVDPETKWLNERRIRSAIVKHGDRISVSGAMNQQPESAPFRESSKRLAPPRGGKLIIGHRVSLKEHAARYMNFHAMMLLLVIFMFCLLQVVLFEYDRRLFGFGEFSGITAWRCALLVAVGMGLPLGYAFSVEARRPWFERTYFDYQMGYH